MNNKTPMDDQRSKLNAIKSKKKKNQVQEKKACMTWRRKKRLPVVVKEGHKIMWNSEK